MRKILLIATGGTIASRPTENGLAPQLNEREILGFVPEISKICDVEAIQLFNLDSTEVRCEQWIEIAKCIRDNYDRFDGFVVTHGTDTMAYTASAISYLVQDSSKPIVFTGSQKSIYMRDTDARNNLYNAFVFAVDPSACLVHIVFEDKVIIGNRARKTRTKSYNAFCSVDFPEAGIIRDGRLIRYVDESKPQGKPKFFFELNPRIFVLKLIPGENGEALSYIKDLYDCLVIESFGVGNIPFYGKGRFASLMGEWIASGKTVVITTQVPYEGSDMSVYEVGNVIKNSLGVMEAYNMTNEAVVTKLMWALGNADGADEIKHLFYTPVQKDII